MHIAQEDELGLRQTIGEVMARKLAEMQIQGGKKWKRMRKEGRGTNS
jgi:hypothetical protein